MNQTKLSTVVSDLANFRKEVMATYAKQFSDHKQTKYSTIPYIKYVGIANNTCIHPVAKSFETEGLRVFLCKTLEAMYAEDAAKIGDHIADKGLTLEEIEQHLIKACGIVLSTFPQE